MSFSILGSARGGLDTMFRNRSIWIAGPSGSGKTVLSGIVDGNDMDQYGYHTDIEHPGENWNISIPVLEERIYWVNSDLKRSPFFFGVMENWTEVASLSWATIAVIMVDAGTLSARLRKRAAYGGEKRDVKKELEKANDTQRQVDYWFDVGQKLGATFIDGLGSPKEVARLIRKLV